MDEIKSIDDFLEKLKSYLNTRLELGKLTAIEKGVLLFANFITGGVVTIFLVLAFLFASLGLSFYISSLLDNNYAGFFIVAGFYFFIALLVYLLKDKYIENRIINAMIKKIFKEEDEEESNDK